MFEEWYESFDQVPLDEQDPELDGDDSIVPGEGDFDAPIVAPRMAGTPVVRTIAPFPGSLRQGSRNKGVRAINKALAKAGYRRWQVFSFVWTRWTTRAYIRFCKAQGVPWTEGGKTVYTIAAHKRLAKHFDAYDLKYLLLAPKPQPTPDEKMRAEFIAELMEIYNRRWSIAYSQARPADLSKPISRADCSASGEIAAFFAGFKRTLSGWATFGAGNTWSQLGYFRSRGWTRGTSWATYKPGDPVYYGRGGSPTHVAYWLGNGRVWSFGSFPAKILPIDYRSDRIVVCNLTGL